MRPYAVLLSSACLCASLALAIAPAAAADSPPNPTGNLKFEEPGYVVKLPAGIDAKPIKELKDVKNAFQSVAESALGRDPLNDIIDRCVDQDRDRLDQNKNNDNAKNGNDALSAVIKQIDNAWHDKYHQDLKIDETKVYTDTYFHAGIGEVSNPDQLVGNWPVPASDAVANVGGDMTSADAQKAHKTFGGDVNLNKGRNVAVVHLAGYKNCPAVTASLIHELPDSWRFDVPNTLTREKLYQNLLANLTSFYGMQAQWPSDPTDATRALTNTVVASLYDINMQNAINNNPEARNATDRMNDMNHGNANANRLNQGNANRTAGER
ncbi:MAG TPA: hypothetical protein VH253_10820 [Phycisphaerae bacterium]|nr:hypothetical protein [Phycisphaerae bacterium]